MKFNFGFSNFRANSFGGSWQTDGRNPGEKEEILIRATSNYCATMEVSSSDEELTIKPVCEEWGVPSIFSRFDPTLLSEKMGVTWIELRQIDLRRVFIVTHHKLVNSTTTGSTAEIELRSRVFTSAWTNWQISSSVSIPRVFNSARMASEIIQSVCATLQKTLLVKLMQY